MRQPSEACDDGNTAEADGCDADCSITRGFACDDAKPNRCGPLCGDGTLIEEACDDANQEANDGCSPECRVEAGWGCAGEPSRCGEICGDGFIVGGETCDDGNQVAGDGCNPACIQRDVWADVDGAPLIIDRVEPAVVWTGSELFVWGGVSHQIVEQGYVYHLETGTTRVVSSVGAPAGVGEFRAFWTGSSVLVLDLQEGHLSVSTYDPRANVWSAPREPPPLSPRSGYAAVWTGAELLVWGGGDAEDTEADGVRVLSVVGDGARYDPVLDVWRPMSAVGAPSPRMGHVGIWTGAELVVWGGHDLEGERVSGARYDPALDAWSPMATTGAPAAVDSAALWTGMEMIVLADEGGRYDPGADVWVPINEHRGRMTAAMWTGSEVLAWDEWELSIYVPAIDQWSSVAADPTPTYCAPCSVSWTGEELILLASSEGGSRYDPSERTWTDFQFRISPAPLIGQKVVWTGSEMLIWGGLSDEGPVGGRYDPVQNTWRWISTIGAPEMGADPAMVWTGSELLVFGGWDYRDDEAVPLFAGGRYRPDLDAWAPMSRVGAPSPRAFASAVWTGSEMVVFGGGWEAPLATGGRYDPARDRWRGLSIVGAPSPRVRPLMVWTGSEVLVWGGATEDSDELELWALADGARYDPATDTWRPMPSGPSGTWRAGFGVWSGRELLIWDSRDPETVWSFDPESDRWSTTHTPTAPRVVRGHGAHLWAGRDVIVWGGVGVDGTGRIDGAIYDTETQIWTELPTQGAPSPRREPLGVWTGTQMIVWGAGGEGRRFLR